MANYSITEGVYLYPTPAGAYFAVCSEEVDPRRQFLQSLLMQKSSPELNMEALKRLAGTEDESSCHEMLLKCQNHSWVQGVVVQEHYPSDLLEKILPDLLSKMSESGNVLLADMHGFHLASHGFAPELADALSGLSADLTTVHERRTKDALLAKLGIASQAWGVIDVFGNTQVGFWPLFIGKNRFVIVISGIPHFNQPEFVKLIWALSIRYAHA